jgi:fructan beta-fructosidase
LLVDNCSIEAFDGNGEFVMTNLVFPEEPYNRISFNAKGGAFTVTSLTIYPFK